jgi:uncharacterized membrane protein
MPPVTPPQRYPEIDVLRTLAILLMIIYHAAYDLDALHGWNIDITRGWWLALQRITACLFIGLVGASFMLSREKMLRRHTSLKTMTKRWLMRAIILFASAMLVTAVTYMFDPVRYVRFGVLHMIATSIVLLPLFASLGSLNIIVGMVFIAAGFMLKDAYSEYLLLLPLGVTPRGFVTMDYFPLLPWFGVALIGAGLASGFYIEASQVRERWNRYRLRIDSLYRRSRTFRSLSVPGRYSLLIYLVHQPILVGILQVLLS